MAAISIFGIGYVGVVAAACLAEEGHIVTTVDVDPKKVDAINMGISPIVEKGLDELIARNVKAGRLTATTSAVEAVSSTDASFVCVGTPSAPNGAVGLKYVLAVCDDIGAAIARKGKFHSVVIRSTIVPGTMEQHAIPALEQASGLTAGKDFGVGYYPEFLRESTAIEDYHDPGLVVFGALDAQTETFLRQLNAHMPVPSNVVGIRTAELIKYTSNSWRAVKITFANEIGNIAKASGIDGQEVMRVICQDTKINISPYFMRPGFAFGGSCLPKDVRALKHLAEHSGVQANLLTAVLAANEAQIERAETMIEETGGKSVGMIGVSFKPGTDDLRESPLAELAARLINKGIALKIYDPYVTAAFSNGTTFEGRGNEVVPELSSRLVPHIEDLLHDSEVILVGNHYAETQQKLSNAGFSRTLVDLARIDPTRRSGGTYQGICW